MPQKPHFQQDYFPPERVSAMAEAFDETCQELGVSRGSAGRDTVAQLVILLARADGQANATTLRDRAIKVWSTVAIAADEMIETQATRTASSLMTGSLPRSPISALSSKE